MGTRASASAATSACSGASSGASSSAGAPAAEADIRTPVRDRHRDQGKSGFFQLYHLVPVQGARLEGGLVGVLILSVVFVLLLLRGTCHHCCGFQGRGASLFHHGEDAIGAVVDGDLQGVIALLLLVQLHCFGDGSGRWCSWWVGGSGAEL